jgi:hypothetical protein
MQEDPYKTWFLCCFELGLKVVRHPVVVLGHTYVIRDRYETDQ